MTQVISITAVFRESCTYKPILGLPRPLPCPFCGCREPVIDETASWPGDEEPWFRPSCPQCGTDGPGGETELEAAREWNMRPGDRWEVRP